jgi:hypothetical protein
MKKSVLIIISFVLTIITLVILYYDQPSKNEICIDAFIKAGQVEYKGLVDKKYIDINHAIPIFIVKDKNNISLKVSNYRDISGLFDYIEVGDSIIKEGDSYEIIVIRNNFEKKFTLDYGCN